MPRPARPWFRFYVEAMRDPKMRRLTPAQRWLWVGVLSAARESYEPGTLYIAQDTPMNCDDLADYAGMRARDVETGLVAMRELGMLTYDGATWRVPAWSERQYESDDVTQRTRRHRSNERGRNVPTSFLGTPPDTEAETDTPKPPHSGGSRAAGTNPRALNVDAVMGARVLDDEKPPCPLDLCNGSGWRDGDPAERCECQVAA